MPAKFRRRTAPNAHRRNSRPGLDDHSGFSYAQVVLGCEVFCSLGVLFAAYLVWHLGTLVRTMPQAIGAVGWILFAYSLVGVYISWIYFSGFVLLLTAAIAICIGWATWLTKGQGQTQQLGNERASA
jgi:hypothetical protein